MPSRVAAALALVGALYGCHRAVPPEAAQRFAGRSFYTCCNLHYTSEEVSDANYWAGKTLAAGTPVRVESTSGDAVTIVAGEVKLTLRHEHGTNEETLENYLEKILLSEDPRPRFAAYPSAVRRAIGSGKVERGMTREQVIASLGHPPSERTPSLAGREWTYWYSRWASYTVVFDEAGKVADVVGRPAPTAERTIHGADRSSASSDAKRSSKRKR